VLLSRSSVLVASGSSYTGSAFAFSVQTTNFCACCIAGSNELRYVALYLPSSQELRGFVVFCSVPYVYPLCYNDVISLRVV
jgi:hypothetical protein